MSTRPASRPRSALLLMVAAAALSVSVPASGEPQTDTHAVGTLFLALSCGPIHAEHFEVPETAVVTRAGLFATLDMANTTALGATLEVQVSGSVVAHNDSAAGLGWLGASGALDVSAINAELANTSASAGLVPLDLVLTVCPNLGVASVLVDQAFITYDLSPAGGANGTNGTNGSTVPPIVGISFNGETSTAVEAGSALTLSAVVNGTLGPNVQVSWFVDGTLVGHGAVVPNVSLSPGEHNISVRASDGTTVRAHSLHVTASARIPPASTPPWALALAAVGGVALAGIAVTRTQAGRWLILGVALGSVFARLKRDSLLDHFTRGALYQVIRENPGIHFAELRRRANLANGSATHHLRMLEKGGYVRVVIDGTKTKFFTTDRALDADVYGISDTDRAVLDAVAGAPGIGQGDLAAKLNRSASVVSRSVARLAALGYVTTTHEGARVQVYPRAGAEAPSVLAPAWPDEGD